MPGLYKNTAVVWHSTYMVQELANTGESPDHPLELQAIPLFLVLFHFYVTSQSNNEKLKQCNLICPY